MAKMQLFQDDSGGVTVPFSIMLLGLTMMLGLTAISLDMDWSRTASQRALDAAVLAGAAPPDLSDEQRISLAQNYYHTNQIISPANGADVEIVSNDPARFGTTDTTVYGVGAVQRKAPFIGLFGSDHINVAVEAAATKNEGSPICVLGLDPTEEATMDFNGHASLELKNCASMANSTDGAGMRQVGQPSMKAKDIGVTGGYSGSAYEPEPMTAAPPVPDPLASLPEPTPGPCGPHSGARITNETITLQPGTYCGGINIQAGSIVTLQPGIYIMKDGALSIQAGAVVSGQEVMIAFLGDSATMYMIGNTFLTLTSPKSGPYANIQFFGDRNVYGRKQENLWFTVIGGSQLTYDGILYIPSFHAWFAGNSTIKASSPNYLAIAKKLWFQDQTKVVFEQDNDRNLNVDKSVSLQKGARLIQ